MASRSDPEAGCSDDVEIPSAPALPALERSLSEQGVPLGLGLPIPTRAVLHEQRYAIELRSRSRARTVTFQDIEDTPIDRLQECTQHVQSPSTERSPPGSRCSPSTSSMLSFDSFDSFNSSDTDDATSDDDSADESSSFAWLSGGGAT